MRNNEFREFVNNLCGAPSYWAELLSSLTCDGFAYGLISAITA